MIDFTRIEWALLEAAYEYLIVVVKKHGGYVSWVDEDGDFRGDIEIPIVAAYLDDGVADLRIRSITLQDGELIIYSETRDYYEKTRLVMDDFVSASQIQHIIEAIPEECESEDGELDSNGQQ